MITIIDCGSDKASDIAAIVDSLGYKNQLVKMEAITDKVVHSSTGFIISGNPDLITESDPTAYLPQFEFLKSTEEPVLGICFGHQVIGMTFGAEVSKGQEDREERTVDVILQNILFEDIERPPVFKEDHSEEVTLPEGFVMLANSDHCPNEAMKHNSNPIYGVQFHPESSGENGRVLFENFCKTCSNT